MLDRYQSAKDALSAPSHRGAVITPDDDNDLEELPKYLYIGETAGALVLRGSDDEDVTFFTTAGQILLFRPKRVLETGSAVGIDVIACY